MEVPVREGGAAETWHPIGSATLSRITFREFRREDLRVAFPERQARRLRIVIVNSDNPPLEISGVESVGPVWQAVFIAAVAVMVAVLATALVRAARRAELPPADPS